MENLEQMTLEQLTSLRKEQLEHYNALRDEIASSKRDIEAINKIFAQKMSDRSPLIGKKVEVVARRFSWSEEKHTIIGFFGGYSTSSSYGNLSIRPIIYKIKKDGTSSKNTYSDFDVPSLEQIINIGEVTE